MKHQTLPAAVVMTLTWCQIALANWPCFRGADGDGKAKNAKAPLTWSDTENLGWKTALPGPGSSSPIVWHDRVFVTCWSGYGDATGSQDISQLKRHLVCLSLRDGTILWDTTVPAAQPEDPYQGFISEHGYASNTPATDGERVYVFFGKSGALAFDLDGRRLWQTDLGRMSSSRRWGSGASVILYKNLVIINASDEGRAIVALDKTTGKEVWKAAADTLELAYSTPVVIRRQGGISDLVVGVPFELWALNPDTGRLRWYTTHNLRDNVSPGVVVGPDALYVTGGFPRQGTLAFKITGGKGDVTAANKLWESNDSSYIPTPVLHEGRLHVINDQGFALCIDAKTGATIFRERALEGGGGGRRGGGKPFYASPILVDGRLYCVSRKNGTFVIAAEPHYRQLGRNHFASDDTQFNGTPAVAGNRLILRSDKAVYCVTGE